MHNKLLDMGMCTGLSAEAALEIGVGSIEIGIFFCTEETTRVRVRREAKVVVPKTGLRSQGPDAASLPGLGASPPADLLSDVATETGPQVASVAPPQTGRGAATVHYTLHNAHATHGPRTRHAHVTHTPLIRRACYRANAPRTRYRRRRVVHTRRVRRSLRRQGQGRGGVGGGRARRGCGAQGGKGAQARGGGCGWACWRRLRAGGGRPRCAFACACSCAYLCRVRLHLRLRLCVSFYGR